MLTTNPIAAAIPAIRFDWLGKVRKKTVHIRIPGTYTHAGWSKKSVSYENNRINLGSNHADITKERKNERQISAIMATPLLLPYDKFPRVYPYNAVSNFFHTSGRMYNKDPYA